MDLNIFDPIGFSSEQSEFVDCLLVHNLLTESPAITAREESEIHENKRRVVDYGRHPNLRLIHDNREISFKRWANDLFGELKLVAKLLDDSGNTKRYSATIENLSEWIDNPDLTFSARIVNEIRESGEGFFTLAMGYSQQHAITIRNKQLPASQQQCFLDAAKQSYLKQQEMEQDTSTSFEEFLAAYFAA